MLNALRLSELLAKNADPRLYPRIFVMSPNGTLMAYSTPVDIKELRDQAALISMAWREHSSQSSSSTNPQSPTYVPDNEPDPQAKLEILTIETQHNNIIVRAIQPSLLLILVGTVPPSRKTVFSITPEYEGDSRYPPEEEPFSSSHGDSNSPAAVVSVGTPGGSDRGKKRTPSILSTMSTRDKDVKLGALHIQRKKIDALTAFIRKDFDAKGFVMPDDSTFP
ncbi:unnamed protein product [Periconia digitata]|uniref:Uncharacterized protein n=1 Tax=Periconia digitata TaxID=1303443 RepID=A0A9W4XNJ0_9PLEO|nr:unnamed protein product [Periconia digitata]